MSKREGVEAAKRLVRKQGGPTAPQVGTLVPEVRTPIKWKPSATLAPAFRPEAFHLVVWSFGVPFKDVEGFHDFLATNELTIEAECATKTNGQAAYLGTYLHVDTGAPRYQAFWGLKADSNGNTEPAEQALAAAFGPPSNFRDLAATLRSYWTRDGNAADLRFGQARHYINFDTLPIDSAFWGVTRLAMSIPPV